MRSSLFLKRVVTTLLCAPQVACVGSIRGGEAVDATTMEIHPSEESDASVNVASDPDATSTRESGAPVVTPSATNDARAPVTASSEAGTATRQDAQVAPPPNTGTGPTPVADAGSTGPTPTNRTPIFAAVGYLGVRVISKDLGKTWINLVTSSSGAPADDNNLLRGVTIANGLLVAAGWKIWTTPDGVNWTERTNPSGQWTGGLQFGNGLFVGAGGSGTSIYSSDGIIWKAGKDRNGEAARTVAFGNGMFIAATDPNNWWATSNGNDWSVMSSGHGSNQVMWCKDHFSEAAACTDPLGRNQGRTAFGENVYVSSDGNMIERSENGKDWTTVTQTKANPIEGIAFGYLTN